MKKRYTKPTIMVCETKMKQTILIGSGLPSTVALPTFNKKNLSSTYCGDDEEGETEEELDF